MRKNVTALFIAALAVILALAFYGNMPPEPARYARLAQKGTPLLDINIAGAADFAVLPGIGAALAERIVAYRAEHGPFAAPDDIMRVKGIGRGKYGQMEKYICVTESP